MGGSQETFAKKEREKKRIMKKRQKLAGSRQSFAARAAECFVMTFGRSTKWDKLRRSRFLDRRHAQTRAKVFGL